MMFTMTSVFTWLAASWETADNFSDGLIVCAIGLEVGYFGAGLIWPLSDRLMLEIAIGTIAFALFYWITSFSTPDRLLAQGIFGTAGGFLAAVIFRRIFLLPPAFPRVP
ncbi:hypothetical protein [Rhizobium sp. NPDC092017]